MSSQDPASCRQQASPPPGQGCPVPPAPGDVALGCGKAVCDNGDVEVEEQCSHPWSTVWLLQACASTPRLSLAQHTLPGMEVVVVLVCISTSPWTSGKHPAPAQVGIHAPSYWSTLFSHCALSSACLCLLTNTCCRWMAGAAAPCTLGRGFPLYIFTREAAPTRADHGPVC